MSLTFLEGELTPYPKPELGPVWIKSFDQHKWTLRASTEGLEPYVALTCEDPCSLPYCPHTRRICCCQWATENESVDIVLDELPVTIKHLDHGRDYWGDYEPGYLELTPVKD